MKLDIINTNQRVSGKHLSVDRAEKILDCLSRFGLLGIINQYSDQQGRGPTHQLTPNLWESMKLMNSVCAMHLDIAKK